jgi:hypothetical protein
VKPAASTVERMSATLGGWANSSCINVPPVNSMLRLSPPCRTSAMSPAAMNAAVAITAMRQDLMKSIFVS